MNDIFDGIFRIFKHFDKFFHWLRDTLKFYTQPKLFIETIINLDPKNKLKKLLGYFIFFESVLLIIASTLINKIQFSLFKIPGLIFLDIIFALPLIIIISISLLTARITRPVNKAVSFVLIFKLFCGLPIQLFFFFFISFENYIFYVLFGALVQLLFISLLILPSLFFADKKIQKIIVFGVTIGLFALSMFIYKFAIKVNSPSEIKIKEESYFDPIFSEYIKYRAKLKLMDEIELDEEINKANRYANQTEEQIININPDKLREDYRYHSELIMNKIKIESDLFTKDNCCCFEVNKKRFEAYQDYLDELLIYLDKYYTVFNIFDLAKDTIKIRKDMSILKNEYEINLNKWNTEFGNIDYLSISNMKIQKERINEQLKQHQFAYKLAELKSRMLDKEISIQDNTIEIEKLKYSILSKAYKLREFQLKISESEANYYSFIYKLRKIFII